MATSYTSLLGLALPVTGELAGTWGDTVNNAITALLDTAVAGTTTLSTDADVTLTTTTGASNQARQAILLCSGARTVLRTITAPAQSKIYVVINSTTGGFGVKLVGAGPTTGVTVAAGKTAVVVWNGTDFVEVAPATATTATNLAGGVAGSLPYQSAASTTTFLGIGAANYVLTSTGTAPTWTINTGTGSVVRATSPTLTTPAITGGTINNAIIGGTTRAAGNFTTLDANGNVILGDASTDTLTVNGYVSIGGTPISSQGLRVIPAALTGTTQFGSVLSITATSAATAGVEAARVQAGTAVAAFTTAYAAGLWVRDALLGAGSTITNNYGVYVDDKTVGTNNYGVISAVSSGANKWNIYASGTADNYFAGNVLIGAASTTATTKLSVITGTTGVTFSRVGDSGEGTDSAMYFGNLSAGTGNTIASSGGGLIFRCGPVGTAAASQPERMRIDSTGNLLIGATTPINSSKLLVAGVTGNTPAVIQGSATNSAALAFYNNAASTNNFLVGQGYGSGSDNIAFVQNQANAALVFGTNNLERVRIDSAGNVGIGVSPSAWDATSEVVEFTAGAIESRSNNMEYALNAYFNGANWIYRRSNVASLYVQSSAGQQQWFTAPSGTAGAAITFTQAMTLTATGNLGIGIATPVNQSANSRVVHIDGGANAAEIRLTNNTTGTAASNGGYFQQTGNDLYLYNAEASFLALGTSNLERMRIDSAGNVGIGTTTPTSTLSVTGSANVTGNVILGDATTDTVTVNGYMGIGGAPDPERALFVRSSALTGASQRGVQVSATASSAATSSYFAVQGVPATAAAVFTAPLVAALAAANATKGAGSTITDLHGVYVADQTQGTNNFGVTSLVSSGANKWNIYASGTADNYFAGDVGIASAPVTSLTVGSLPVSETGSTSYGSALLRGANYTLSNTQRGILDVEMSSVGAQDAGATISFTNNVNQFGQGLSYVGAALKAGKANATNTNQSTYLAFYTNSSGTLAERLRIDSAGNVGIGTSSPQARLHVAVDGQGALFTRDGVASLTLRTTFAGTDGSFLIAQKSRGTGASPSIVSSGDRTWDIRGSGYDGAAYQAAGRITIDVDGAPGINSMPGRLVFYTTPNLAASPLERMRIDSAGNVGIGITPNAWGSAFRAIEGNSFSLAGTTSSPGTLYLANNSYINSSSQYIYKNSAAASIYYQTAGQHNWWTAASGTAGNVISFTQALMLDASGNLGVGTTPSAWITGATSAIQLRRGSVSSSSGGPADHIAISANAYNTGSNDPGLTTWTYSSAGRAELYEQRGGSHIWYNSPVGVAGDPITFTQAMVLGASGILSVAGNAVLGDASTDTVTVNGYMGVGAAAVATNAIYVRNAALTGTTQTGVNANLIGTSAATSSIRGFSSTPETAAAAFTVTNLTGYWAANAVLGSGSTITNQHGLYIADQTTGTNNFGVTSLVSSGANKWNIYAGGTADNYFAGNVGVGSGVGTPSAQLHINNDSANGYGTLRLEGSNRAGQIDFYDRTFFVGQYLVDQSGNTFISTGSNLGSTVNERLRFTGTEAVFNDPGNDYDLRVESDTNTHALFVQGSDGNVGIGTASPLNKVDINGSLGRNAPVTKTTSFTLAATENWLICNGTGTITVTLPAASSWTGREVMIKNIAAFTVVSASSNVVPLAGGAAGTAILAATAGAWATLVSDGTNWIIMQA